MPAAREDLRLRHGGAARLRRRPGDAVFGTSRAGGALRQGASERVRRHGRARPAERRGDPRLHLGHDGAAEGGHAEPPQHPLPARLLGLHHEAGGGGPAALLPAPVPCGRAHLHGLQSAAPGEHRQLRREHRHGAREHSRGRARAVLRRAADLGEVLLRRRAAHAGGHCARQARLPLGDRNGYEDGGVPHRRPDAVAWPPAGASRGGLARPRQHSPLDRPAPGTGRRHRGRADRARADQVVPRARHRHARGVRPDGELRPRHGHAGQPHQARHRRRRPTQHRGPHLARGGNPPEGTRTSSSVTTTSRRRRRKRSWTGGCTRATSGTWTPTASSPSPTA